MFYQFGFESSGSILVNASNTLTTIPYDDQSYVPFELSPDCGLIVANVSTVILNGAQIDDSYFTISSVSRFLQT